MFTDPDWRPLISISVFPPPPEPEGNIFSIAHLSDVVLTLNSKYIILKLIIRNSDMGTRCDIALRWMSHNLINEKSTLD